MRARAKSSVRAMLIGYEDQENLGLRSIKATLDSYGFHSVIIPYVPGNVSNVVSAVKEYNPDLVGISIIFQYTFNEFGELASTLRKEGVRAHFTAGGHFPSLRPREVLEALPDLDSVIRFEGEYTTLDLMRQLHRPETWDSIEGLVFRRGTDIVVNPPRPLIADLDALPQVKREPRMLTRGVKAVSMLASRGCLHNCSFCSIRQFYGGPPGRLRRTRKPEAVVAEMNALYEEDGVRLFIFQDDDFAAKSRQQRQWNESYLEALSKSALSEKIRWKISCRVDDLDEDLFSRFRDHGLIMIYLGVESGNPAGLKTLNKLVTVEQNYKAVELLKKIGIAFDMGFMLFDPDSTVDSIRENIHFLRRVTADGECPANFCKMLPYAGTPIEARLIREGRLKGTLSQPDYDFPDPRLDWFSLYAAMAFRFRNFDKLGLVERLRLAKFDLLLANAFEPGAWIAAYERELRDLTARCSAVALDYLETALDFIAARDVGGIMRDWPLLHSIAGPQWDEEIEIQQQLDSVLLGYNPALQSVFENEFRRTSERQGAVGLSEAGSWPSGPPIQRLGV